MNTCDCCQHVEMCGWRESFEGRGCDFFDDGNRWIPVSEKLPEENQIVVVANKDKKTWDFGQFKGVIYTDDKGRQRWNWKKNTCRIVDYWMPKENAIQMPWKEQSHE